MSLTGLVAALIADDGSDEWGARVPGMLEGLLGCMPLPVRAGVRAAVGVLDVYALFSRGDASSQAPQFSGSWPTPTGSAARAPLVRSRDVRTAKKLGFSSHSWLSPRARCSHRRCCGALDSAGIPASGATSAKLSNRVAAARASMRRGTVESDATGPNTLGSARSMATSARRSRRERDIQQDLAWVMHCPRLAPRRQCHRFAANRTLDKSHRCTSEDSSLI